MSAFLIADVSPSDMQAYRDSGYIENVPKIAAEYGGVYRARGGNTEVLEGTWQPKRLVIIEFPSWDQLRAFFVIARPMRPFETSARNLRNPTLSRWTV